MPGASRGPDGLTPSQRALAEAYLGPAEQSALRAYRLAKPHSKAKDKTAEKNATRTLADPQVKAYIDARLVAATQQVAKSIELSAARWLEEVAGVAFANIADFITVDPKTGVGTVDLAKLPRALLAAVSEVQQEITLGSDGKPTHKTKVKLHSKLGALEMIGKKLGELRDILEITGKGGGPVETKGTYEVTDFLRERFGADVEAVAPQKGPAKDGAA